MKQIIAIGGGGFLVEPDNPKLDDYILARARRTQPRVCLIPTASGDSDRMITSFYTWLGPRCACTHLSLFNRRPVDLEAFVLEQDILYVGGGNTANMLAV